MSFQRLHPELPLSLEELEKVFVTLDADGNGSLTPKEFTTGFSEFGKHVSCIELYSYSILSTSIKQHFYLNSTLKDAHRETNYSLDIADICDR